MHFVIVSTFPATGSMNIGDQLITDCLIDLIKEVRPNASFDVIWRAEKWEDVRDILMSADHVFFACLAIRPNMAETEYPFLSELLSRSIPFSVIAAGTALPVSSELGVFEGFPERTRKLLSEVEQVAHVFTTRGGLTQRFCQYIGLRKARYAGDIAFYDRRFERREFVKGAPINRIAISTPHYESVYIDRLRELLEGLRAIFPIAEIMLVQHGRSALMSEFAYSRGVDCFEIYKQKHSGLDIYDTIDLHVGFRVHGHVSALKRRKYSYLLEQDGRGCDYGLSLNPKISIPCHVSWECKPSARNVLKAILGRPLTRAGRSPRNSIPYLIALVEHDRCSGFEKFCGLERQIQRINEGSRTDLQSVISRLSPRAGS